MLAHGIRWGIGYVYSPPSPVCGYIINRTAERIHELRWCGQPAVYGFRFADHNGSFREALDALGGWEGACAEHAAAVRVEDQVATMWSL